MAGRPDLETLLDLATELLDATTSLIGTALANGPDAGASVALARFDDAYRAVNHQVEDLLTALCDVALAPDVQQFDPSKTSVHEWVLCFGGQVQKLIANVPPENGEGTAVQRNWSNLRPALASLALYNPNQIRSLLIREAAFARNERQKRQPDHQQDATPARAIASEQSSPPGAFGCNVIAKDGANWRITFEDEAGLFPVKDYAAIEQVLVKVLPVPGKVFQLKDFYPLEAQSILADPSSKQPAAEKSLLLQQAKTLIGEREKYAGDPVVQTEIDKELLPIQEQLKTEFRRDGSPRDINRSERDTAWDTLTKGLSRLLPRLKSNQMPKLAAHLKASLDIDKPTITYQPPTGAAGWKIS